MIIGTLNLVLYGSNQRKGVGLAGFIKSEKQIGGLHFSESGHEKMAAAIESILF